MNIPVLKTTRQRINCFLPPPPLRRTLEIMPTGVDGVYRRTEFYAVCCMRLVDFQNSKKIGTKACADTKTPITKNN
jgi:hypothetical protein